MRRGFGRISSKAAHAALRSARPEMAAKTIVAVLPDMANAISRHGFESTIWARRQYRNIASASDSEYKNLYPGMTTVLQFFLPEDFAVRMARNLEAVWHVYYIYQQSGGARCRAD